jgi:hypothetical protein
MYQGASLNPDIPPYYIRTLHFVQGGHQPLLERYCLQQLFLSALALLYIINCVIPSWLVKKDECVTFLVPISFQIKDEDAKPARCTVDGNSIALEHLHMNKKAAAPQSRRPAAYRHRQ